ncbi:MAG: integrase [Pseudomonadota bacterium]|nr:integrase [Pseudomonadota bacterium]
MDRQAEALPNGIRIRGNSIQIDFYYNGVRYREALKLIPNAKNIKYASKMKDAILFDIERNQFDYAKYFPKSKKLKVATEQKSEILFLDIINKQSELYKRRYNNGKMSISTWKGYEKSINGHLIPMFGKLLLKDITPLLIRNWLYTFTNRSKTITNILIPLKAALKNAIKDGLINENPADKVDVADIIKDIGLPKKEVIDPFTQEEKKAIIKAAHEQVKNLIQFGFWSGLRTGELIALRWSDIDFEAGLINVTKNIVFGEEKQPKTRSGIRSVLMLPNAREALTAQFLHTGFAGDFVFHNPHLIRVSVPDFCLLKNLDPSQSNLSITVPPLIGMRIMKDKITSKTCM